MTGTETIVHTERGITFVYTGGPYIDMFWHDDIIAAGLTGDRAVPFTVINVFDYAANKASIERTAEGVAAKAAEWFGDNDTDEIRKYRENS